MRSSLFFPFVARFCAAELVTAAYLGILGRAPDDPGLRAHCAELGWRRSAGSSLAELLAAISHSPERWKRTLEQRAGELVRAVFRGILKREPHEQELRPFSAQVSGSGDLSTVVANLAASQEHWAQLVEARSEELTLRFYRALFGRDPVAATLKSYAAQLKASKDLSGLVAAIGASEEFWHRQITHHAEDIVRASFRTLLGREPEDSALESYAEQLRQHRSLEQLLAAIGQSPEHRQLVQRDGAEELVRTAFASLLNREPEEEALKAYVSNIRRGQPLGEVLAAMGSSEEHWRLLVRAHAEEIVTALFRGLLKREPDSYGLAGHVAQLRGTNDLAAVVSAIGGSRERELLFKKESEWPNPARSYDEPTWVFMHAEKTGGTSLQNMLLQSFRPERVYHEHEDTLHLHSPAELSMYSVFAGHFNHDSLAFIPRHRLKVFMFVREPRQRLLSLYYFWRSHDPSSPRFNETMKLAQELSIETYYASRDVARSPSTWNHMTWCVMGNRQWREWRRLLEGIQGERRTRVIESLRDPIRERLREFCFVGLQEKFTQSCRQLFRTMDRTCPDVRRDHSVEQLAATTSYIKGGARPALTTRAVEVMADLVELDTILYEEARILFAERTSRRGKRARARRPRDSSRARLKTPASKSARNAL